MAFTDQQLSALRRGVSARRIRRRTAQHKEFRYIEGWFAIAEANRIFGFDGWDRETVDSRCIQARDGRGGCHAIYSARVRITVRTPAGPVVRDGLGSGEGHGGRLAEAHDLALKAAETDATKRALVTFGKAFGLMLYSDRRPKERTAVSPRPSSASNGVRSASGPRPAASSVRAPAPPAPNGTRVDKSKLALGEPRRIRDKDHLIFVAAQACLVCRARPADAHHVRYAQPRALGVKASDEYTVPLCRVHHTELHAAGNEKAWWHEMGVDPLAVARELWEESHRSSDEELALNGAGGPVGRESPK
jgi:hypothetical protein